MSIPAFLSTIIFNWDKSEKKRQLELNIKHNIEASIHGALCFIFLLTLLQIIFKLFKLSCNQKYASLIGFFSVVWISLLSSMIVVESRKSFGDENSIIPFEFVYYSVSVSVIYFLLTGRTFRKTLPSSLLHQGAFAVESIPQDDYEVPITNKQRLLTQYIGYKFGCHSCGRRHSRLVNNFHRLLCKLTNSKMPIADYFADHQPPFAINKSKKLNSGVLLPHCRSCSYQQAGCVKKAISDEKWQKKSREHLLVHSLLEFRLYKLWLPWPIILHQQLYFSLYQLIVHYVYQLFLLITDF